MLAANEADAQGLGIRSSSYVFPSILCPLGLARREWPYGHRDGNEERRIPTLGYPLEL